MLTLYRSDDVWKIIDGPKVVKASKPLVERWVSMTPAPDDRPLQPARLQRHLKSIEAGTMRAPEWASAVCREDGVEYRINGKHTAMAMSQMERPRDLSVILTTFECATKKEVAQLYSTYDAKWSVRNSRDIYKVYFGSVPELAAIGSFALGPIVGGVCYGIWGGEAGRRLSDERAEETLKHPEFCVWANEVMGSNNADNRYLARVGVVAAMFLGWAKSKAASKEFWLAVRDGTDPNPKSPSRQLQRFLMTCAVKGGGGLSDKKAVTTHEVCSRCVSAWNAWRRGTPLDRIIYRPSTKLPVAA